MTLKYPSSGYGMSAPSAQTSLMNKLAASNNAAAGTSSWKMPSSSAFPTLKGATGNNLYPAPKTTASYPSVSSYTSKLTPSSSSSSSYPSLSSYFPSASKTTGATGNTLYPAPKQTAPANTSNPFSSTSSFFTAMSGGGAPTGAAQTRTVQMPTGFASGALGSGSPQPKAAAPQPAPTMNTTAGAPRGPQASNMSNAGGVAYYAGDGKQTHSSVTGPGALHKGVVGAGTKTGVDQWGRTYYYNDTGGAQSSQPIAGVSNTGTVLRVATNSDGTPAVGANGQPIVYDTGVQAFMPTQPARQPQPTATPVVGRPTQPSQPVSVAVPSPSAWAPPPLSQDEIDSANQGRWLG